jgi:hypothetical protein
MSAPPLVSPTVHADWIADHPVATPPGRADMAKRSGRLTALLTAELLGESERLEVSVETLMTAALGRALHRTVGEGTVAVRVDGELGDPVVATIDCAGAGHGEGPAILECVRLGGHVHTANVAVSYRTQVEGAEPEEGCLLTLHGRLGTDVLYLEWWYGTRSFDTVTIVELDEQFRLGITAVTAG